MAWCLWVHMSNHTVSFSEITASKWCVRLGREGKCLGTNQSEKGIQAAGKGTQAASNLSTKRSCTEKNKAKLNPLLTRIKYVYQMVL